MSPWEPRWCIHYVHVALGSVLVRCFIQMCVVRLNGGTKMTGRKVPVSPHRSSLGPHISVWYCCCGVLWLFPEIQYSVTPQLSVLTPRCPCNREIAWGHISYNACLSLGHAEFWFVYSSSFPEALGGSLIFGTPLTHVFQPLPCAVCQSCGGPSIQARSRRRRVADSGWTSDRHVVFEVGTPTFADCVWMVRRWKPIH